MEKNAYYDLGLKLAFQQAGFSDDFLKDAGIISAFKDLLRGAAGGKASGEASAAFKAWRKSKAAKAAMKPGLATETATYGKYRPAVVARQQFEDVARRAG